MRGSVASDSLPEHRSEPPADGAPVVVVGSDGAFALPLAITMSSLLSVLPEGAVLYVLDGGISDAHRKRLSALAARRGPAVHVQWIRPDTSRIDGLPTKKRLRKATYFRLLIPQELPETVTRVLYLDTDIVVRREIDDLWKIDLGGHSVAACQDLVVQRVDRIAPYQEAGFSPNADYFNAGVLLMDLARWRAEGTSDRVVANIVANGDKYPLLDQDGLNAVLSENWSELPPQWNVQVGSQVLGYQPLSVDEAGIVHFTGKAKPWSGWWMLKNRRGVLSGYGRLFSDELKRSEWFSSPEYVWFWIGLNMKGAGTVLWQTLPARALRFAGRRIRRMWQHSEARSAWH